MTHFALICFILFLGIRSNRINPAARSMLSIGTRNRCSGVELSIGAFGSTYEYKKYSFFFSHRITLKKCVGTATFCAPITSYFTYNLLSASLLSKKMFV